MNQVIITFEEIAALVEMASRAPKTQAEVLWLQGVIERINQSRSSQQGESAEA